MTHRYTQNISHLELRAYVYLSEPCHREDKSLPLQLHIQRSCPFLQFSSWTHWGLLSIGEKQQTSWFILSFTTQSLTRDPVLSTHQPEESLNRCFHAYCFKKDTNKTKMPSEVLRALLGQRSFFIIETDEAGRSNLCFSH